MNLHEKIINKYHVSKSMNHFLLTHGGIDCQLLVNWLKTNALSKAIFKKHLTQVSFLIGKTNPEVSAFQIKVTARLRPTPR